MTSEKDLPEMNERADALVSSMAAWTAFWPK